MKFFSKQNRPFIGFIIRFLVTYVVLFGCYQYFLYYYSESGNSIDPITKMVSSHVGGVLSSMSYYVQMVEVTIGEIHIMKDGKTLARIIEGCNAVSVMVLFVSFVVAFRGTIKRTVGFVIFGVIVIYMLNVIRIGSITMLLEFYPSQEHLIHGVLFPAFIYGVVMVLWLIWVNKFATYEIQSAD